MVTRRQGHWPPGPPARGLIVPDRCFFDKTPAVVEVLIGDPGRWTAVCEGCAEHVRDGI